MKTFIFLISFLFIVTGFSYGQSNVVDSHPDAAIYVIDYSTGQTVQGNYDTANLFKDAFIDLVLSTDIAQRESGRRFPGEKQFVVEQLDPQNNGNSYKLNLLSRDRNSNTTFTIYTFVYNADNNTLTFLNQQYNRYVPVQIDSQNQNLSNCYSYGLFNAPNQQGADNTASAQTDTPVDVDVSTEVAPPQMPDYQQPECPADGYLWQPGYWGYNPRINTYYWVPGAWVAPPTSGVVWTPPYWGYEGRIYVFHSGYWGEHVGFYGGINYGYGYGGHGFYGGEWRDNHYHYNTAVTRVNTTVVHNTYINNTVVVNNTVIVNNHSSFNGAGGVVAKPTETEMVAVHEHHEMPTPEQNRNQQLARSDKNQFVAPGSNAKPANVAVERVPVKPVNNNPSQRPGMQGNLNRPAFRPEGGNTNGASQPANNPGNRPANTQPANPNMPRTGTVEPTTNPGTRPAVNDQPNPNNGRVGVTPLPANNNTRPTDHSPNVNTTTPVMPATTNTNQPHPAPTGTTTPPVTPNGQKSATPAATGTPTGSNGQGKRNPNANQHKQTKNKPKPQS